MDQSHLDATLCFDPSTSIVHQQTAINTAAVDEQLTAERAVSAKCAVLCEALEELESGADSALNLPPASLDAFRQIVDQLLCAEFATLPTAKSADVPLLGLDSFGDPPAHSFSYADRKAIRSAVVELAERRQLGPVLEFIADKRRQPAAFNVFAIEQMRRDVLQVERHRQRLEADLLQAHRRRDELLRQAVELRFGGSAAFELEMDERLKRLQLNAEKIGQLKAMIELAFINSSEHSPAALRCIDNHLNEALKSCRK